MKTTFLFSLLVLSLNAQAFNFNLKPGLWEVTHKTEMDGKDLSAQMKKAEAAMKKMSPEQRQMMEQMMKSKGVDVSGGPGKIKVCYTKEMIEKRSLMQGQANCKIENQKDLNDGISFEFKCDSGTGKAEYHLKNDTNYFGKMDVQSKRGNMKMDFNGKFLATDCGDVKPMQSH